MALMICPHPAGERRRKSVRGCIISADLSVLNLKIVKKGEAELPGLTDEEKPRMRGPKRASKIRKLFNLGKVGWEGGKCSAPVLVGAGEQVSLTKHCFLRRMMMCASTSTPTGARSSPRTERSTARPPRSRGELPFHQCVLMVPVAWTDTLGGICCTLPPLLFPPLTDAPLPPLLPAGW